MDRVRLAWWGSALALLALAPLDGRLWPFFTIGRTEASAHILVAAAIAAAGLLAPRKGRAAGATVLLAAAGVYALSPSLLGLRADVYVEPLQCVAYASLGAWLALSEK